MKTTLRNCSIIFLMTTIPMSCKNKVYVNNTEVFKDGSCYRTMSVTGDSSILAAQVFPVLIDSSWKKNISKTNDERNPFQIKASKQFNNVNELNAETPNDSVPLSKLKHSFNLEKKFRWFYTHLSYKETYSKINPFELIPVSDYLSSDELLLITDEPTKYLAGRDSDEIEKIKDQIMSKAFAWAQVSIYEEFIHTLSENAHLIGNPAINYQSIKAKKDTIRNYIKFKEEDISNVLFDVDSMLKICSICFNTKGFEQLDTTHSQVFNKYLEKGFKLGWLYRFAADTVKNSVVMPGLIINTNCKSLIGNKIQWEFTPMKCFFNDYEIIVTSRIINRWAFVVGAVSLALLIAGLVFGVVVRGRK